MRRVVFIPIAAAPPEEGRDSKSSVSRFGVFFLKTLWVEATVVNS